MLEHVFCVDDWLVSLEKLTEHAHESSLVLVEVTCSLTVELAALATLVFQEMSPWLSSDYSIGDLVVVHSLNFLRGTFDWVLALLLDMLGASSTLHIFVDHLHLCL